MDIFSLLHFCGGLAFFLYGMHTLSASLEKMAGGKLEQGLKRMTSSPLKGLALGAGITIAIQSSSAVTVMLVGLVNSGIMELNQTVGVIMGSNAGTTITAWILSLSGIESGSVWMQLLKPENFSPVLALIGALLIMAAKTPRRRDIGRVLVGFSVLMYGMELMKDTVSPLADMPEFTALLTAFRNPLLGVLVGTVFTGIIQSSSASVGILQALAMTGGISYGMAVPIITGQNIGTCVTVLLSTFGVSRAAKRVAAIHMSFNVIGAAACLALFYGGNALFHFPFLDAPINAVGVAACHTAFNLITTALLFPFSRQMEALACRLVPAGQEEEPFAFLDPRLLRTPGVAIGECAAMTDDMARLAHENVLLALEQLRDYSKERAEQIAEGEDRLDTYEDHLSAYLVASARKGISLDDSRKAARLLHAIGDFERIGDHAQNLQESAQELREKGLTFSGPALEELRVLAAAVTDILERTFDCFLKNDCTLAAEVEPLEETVDALIEMIRLRHIDRLQSGECTVQLGFILSDLLTNFERVSDHCSNVAVCVIETAGGGMDAHAYVRRLHDGDQAFAAQLERNLRRYQLPGGAN